MCLIKEVDMNGGSWESYAEEFGILTYVLS